MKQLILFLALFSFGVSAQTWQTIPSEHYDVVAYTFKGTGSVSFNSSQFEINQYDGTMWFISNLTMADFDIKRINTDGSMTLFTPSNMPFMDVNSRFFVGIGFSSNRTFLLHEFDGVFSYNGAFWNNDAAFDKGSYVCSDSDTLYFSRVNEGFARITESGTTYNWAGSRRLAVKNGSAWSSNSFNSGTHKLNSAYSSATVYNADTCNLLDNSNHDFKFTRNSDTLYVAGEHGFSLAYGETFVDTITMNTAPNMPYPSIIEFEFDSQDNIWAVFGDGGTQGFLPNYIAYYDRSVQDWTLIYDASSCPVDFTERLDIEIDADDNLWVCDRFNLHVLKINNTPDWLSLIEEENQEFSVYPNPSSGNISIKTEAEVTDLEVLDVSGRLIQSMPFSNDINIEEKGTYLIRLLHDRDLVGTQKVVIE